MPKEQSNHHHQQQQQHHVNDDDDVRGCSSSSSEKTPLLLLPPTTKKDQEDSINNDVDNDNDDLSLLLEEEEEERKKWIWTTIALAVSLLVQSYLLVSVFPYSGFMAMHLVGPTLSEETAGKYAGWIASSFMFGRTFSSYHWGKAADYYGRTFVIKSSLFLSAIFSILFGLSTSFPLCLFWRFLMGLSNGLIGPVKTLVSEICCGNSQRETKSLAIIFGMWGYGFLLNPAISGYLSDPIKQYPNVIEFGCCPTMTNFLMKFPYFIPNVVGSIYCIIAYAMVSKCVEETLPKNKRKQFNIVDGPKQLLLRTLSSFALSKHVHTTNPNSSVADDDDDNDKGNDGTTTHHPKREYLPRWVRPSPSTTALTILSSSSSQQEATKSQKFNKNNNNHKNHNNETGAGLVVEELSESKKQQQQNQNKQNQNKQKQQQQQPGTIRNLWARKATRQHLLLYWFFSFGVISIDEIFPLFCISKDSGLGVQESKIGIILTGTGIFYVIIQYVMVTTLVDAFGYYKTMRIGAFGSLPLCILIPISLTTNRNALEGELTISTMSFLSVIYAIIRAFSSVTFSTITMTTNRTVPTQHRATMNGLSMLGGSLAKGIGPAFAGILFSSTANNVTPPYGSVIVYGIISSMGIGIFFQSIFINEQHNQEILLLSTDDEDEDGEVKMELEPPPPPTTTTTTSEAAIPSVKENDDDNDGEENDGEEAPSF